MGKETTTITRKIQLRVINVDKNKSWEVLRSIDRQVYMALNYTINNAVMREELVDRTTKNKFTPTKYKKLTNKEISKHRNESRKEVDSFISNKGMYRQLGIEFKELPSPVLPSIRKTALSKFDEIRYDLKRGAVSTPNYRKGSPIPTIKDYLKFNENYQFRWYKGIIFEMVFGRDRSNNKEIVDRIQNGDYGKCDSSIQVKGKKIYLLLSLKIPKEIPHLDEDKIVGVDLGVSNTAVCGLTGSKKRLFIPNGILQPRTRIQRRRKKLQRSLRYVKGGRGRKNKLKSLNSLKNKERNIVRTINHKVSKDVVDFALKNNAHKINIEDLKGFSKKQKDSFILRNWSYFELQTMIEQKASRYSIIVEKVKPTYTSQICNSCNSKGSRDTQSEFVCRNSKCKIGNKKVNADYNAAINIANGGFDVDYNKENREIFKNTKIGDKVFVQSK